MDFMLLASRHSSSSGVGTVIFMVVLCLILFILFFRLIRDFLCWYWRITERVNKLESIDNHLAKIEKILSDKTLTDNDNSNF